MQAVVVYNLKRGRKVEQSFQSQAHGIERRSITCVPLKIMREPSSLLVQNVQAPAVGIVMNLKL
jgi:hypothetical protein